MMALSIYIIFGILTLIGISTVFIDYPERVVAYLKHLWLYFLFFTVTASISHNAGIIFLALISFLAMREYFTLVSIRPQDRIAVWGAFFTIPCMAAALFVNGYQPFIIFILLYSFLGISFLVVTGGGKSEGTIFSIGIVTFGILLFVVGNGHVGFMTFESIELTVLVVIAVGLTDTISFYLSSSPKWPGSGWYISKYLVSIPITVLVFLIGTNGSALSTIEALTIGVILPVIVAANRYIMIHIEKDLGIAADYETLRRGRLINSSCPLIMTVPIIFQFKSFFVP